ncbi:MAG: ribonuclease P protein component [Bacteroidales bacterium]|nr:ribonuclease P protein component [Bacteroidales bacterium]
MSKHERLCARKDIENLFKNGKYLNLNGLKIVYLVNQNSKTENVKILISVPKRLYKKASDRNLIKRRVREAYRKNKSILKENINKLNLELHIAFIISSNKMPNYAEIETKILVSLQTLNNSLITTQRNNENKE